MDKFLLAENPMRPKDSGLFIVHLLNPVAIFGCVKGRVDIEGKVTGQYSFRNSDGLIEEWTFYTQFFFTSDFITEPDEQVKPLMNKAWRWFRSYLEWEDTNIDIDESSNDN